MQKQNEVAAVVFLYQYDELCIDNIRTYANQLDIVYAYDNSIERNYELEEELKKIQNLKYIGGNGNDGLSVAINVAAKLAIEEGCKWLVTFDQDSRATGDMILSMKAFADSYEDIERIGIISPLIKKSNIEYGAPAYDYSFIDCVIQSGSMINLKILESLGFNDENLFIDHVDIQYCFQLMNAGYRIIRYNHAVLIHNLGDDDVVLKWKNGKKYYINKFSPARYYYTFRNSLYCYKKYGKDNLLFGAYLKTYCRNMWNTWKLEDEKWKRGKAIFWGVYDYLFHNMGKSNRTF